MSIKDILKNLINIKVNEIINHAKSCDSNFTNNKTWYVGITNNPVERKKSHEREKDIDCVFFRKWDLKKEVIARVVEKQLSTKGFVKYAEELEKLASYFNIYPNRLLKEARATESESTFVYVYKALSKAI